LFSQAGTRSPSHVVGARPNFVKAAPVVRAPAGRAHVCQRLVHTGQHYDVAMSGRFLQPRAQIDTAWLREPRLKLTEPLSYLEFIGLEQRAALVITDSGGVQEETTYLGVPCLTVRDNTERPVMLAMGTNRLVGRDPDALLAAAREALREPRRPHQIPELWDGHARERAPEVILEFLRSSKC
jgi:UDP-N-acetylglucosamine 2-epimerase